jgi:hypothetical protein
MIEYYGLRGKEIISLSRDDSHQIIESFQSKRILRSELRSGHIISTVFLSIDHGYNQAEPVLFETMIFKDESDYKDLYCRRFTSYDEAFKAHLKLLEFINDRGIEAVIEGSTL